MWTGQKLLQVNLRVEFHVKCCRLLTDIIVAIQKWLRLDQSAAANCDEDIMLVTTAGFRQMWCPEHVEGGSRGRMWGGQQNDASEEWGPGLRLLFSQQNDGTCSFLQAGPRIWGVWRQSIEQGKQGRFGQKQIYLDRKFWDFDFVLECLRTALWCLYCGCWQSGSAGSPIIETLYYIPQGGGGLQPEEDRAQRHQGRHVTDVWQCLKFESQQKYPTQ